jgi:integrase
VEAKTVAAALKSAGATADQIKAALASMGLEMPAPEEKKPDARTVSSEAQVQAAKPGTYRVTRANRLYLKKTSHGAGSYFLRYRIGDRRPSMGLGSISDVTLAQVRARAEELGGKLGRRVDLLAERRAEREAAQAEARKAARLTVKEAVMAYVEANAPTWKHIYARANWLNPVERYAFPVIGHLKVDAVEPRHILAVLKAADEKGVATLGKKVRSRLKTVFDHLIAHGQRDAALGNPADAGVINAGRPKNGKNQGGHYRRIALDDAPATFTKLYELAKGGDNVAIACWVFMALTAARPGEALAAKWEQVNLDKALWLNPVEKTEKVLEVPLSSTAIALLKEHQRRLEAEGKPITGLIFAGNGGGQLAHSNLAGAPKRAGIEAGTPHSWRSLFRDAVEDKLGFRRETAEAALAHSLGPVEKAYRRESGVDARRVMMEAYVGWLTGKGGDNVVAFPASA